MSQYLDPALAPYPRVHTEQALSEVPPVLAAALPAGQLVQGPEPPVLYFPTPHVRHEEPDLYFPAMQPS